MDFQQAVRTFSHWSTFYNELRLTPLLPEGHRNSLNWLFFCLFFFFLFPNVKLCFKNGYELCIRNSINRLRINRRVSRSLKYFLSKSYLGTSRTWNFCMNPYVCASSAICVHG